MARIKINNALIDDIKDKFPELNRMSATDIVDWALQKALKRD